MDGEQLGMYGMIAGLLGLVVAFMLYRKVDSIEIENKTVAKITERIQDGAMAFMVAEYRMLAVFIAVVAALLFIGGNYDDDLGICLLYTSPSPRDRLLSRMPSSA